MISGGVREGPGWAREPGGRDPSTAMTSGAGYVVAVAAVLVVTAVVVRRPQRGVLLLAALVPFDGLLLVVPHPEIVRSWKEIVTILILAATFLPGRTDARVTRRNLPAWSFPLLALIVIAGLSALTVGFVQAETGFRIDFFYVLLAVALWRTPLDAGERDHLVTIFAVVGLLTAVVGIAQQIIGSDRLHRIGYPYNTVIRNANGHLRSFSTFSQPFPFAFYLMLVVVIVLPVALAEPRRARNAVFLFSLPVLGVAMFFAIVRGAWLGTFAGLVYLGIRRHRKLLLAFPAVAVGAATLLFILPGTVASSALSATSLSQRATSWHHQLSPVLRHPLGSGIGSTGAAAEKTATLTSGSKTVFQPDDYYLKEVYELGVPGLACFVLVLFLVFRDADRCSRTRSGPDAALASGIAASIVAVAAASSVATYLEIFPMDVLFWLLIAVVATCPLSPSTA